MGSLPIHSLLRTSVRLHCMLAPFSCQVGPDLSHSLVDGFRPFIRKFLKAITIISLNNILSVGQQLTKGWGYTNPPQVCQDHKIDFFHSALLYLSRFTSRPDDIACRIRARDCPQASAVLKNLQFFSSNRSLLTVIPVVVVPPWVLLSTKSQQIPLEFKIYVMAFISQRFMFWFLEREVKSWM